MKMNPDITWIVFTDNKKCLFDVDNVKVVYMQFSELRQYIQSKFDFELSLEHPYKLCDFKPAYGFIFSEYLEEYDFWGHCDLDLLWGNLRSYLSDALLENYDFIYREGHLRLYRNIDDINRLFMRKGSIFQYKKVFSCRESHGFDEALGIQRIAERNSIKMYYDDNVVADIDPFQKPLYIRRIMNQRWKDEAGIFRSIKNYKYQIFMWKNGKVFRYYLEDGSIKKDEFMYIHFLKRKMRNTIKDEDVDCIIITPDSFLKGDEGMLEKDRIIELSQGSSGQEKESLGSLLKRKVRRATETSFRQKIVVVKKGFYFVIEKFI